MKAIFFIYILSLIYVHIATAIRPKSANYASMISIGDKEEGLAYERLSQVLRVRGGGVWDVQTEGGFNGLLEKAGIWCDFELSQLRERHHRIKRTF